MDLGLRDRVCVVTGSTGGIGLETARLLAGEGARVVVSGREPARAERARADVGAHRAFAGDLSQRGEPERLIYETVDALGRLDVLVNNVGYAEQRAFPD